MSTSAFYARLDKQLQEVEAESLRLAEAFGKFSERLCSDDDAERFVQAAGFAAIIDKIYTKTEAFLSAIAKKIDDEVPTGDSWHRELLQQMCVETDERPAFISSELFGKLDELRAFRHFERNSYSSNIDASLIPGKVGLCVDSVLLLRQDFDAFAKVFFERHRAPPASST